MIFASDLDQTLIYSKRFLNEELEGIIVVEKREEEDISHMTRKAINLLKLINERILFIPTTTRSMEQYRRISVFQNEIIPKYAVVANGSIILIEGEIDSKWQGIIATKMKKIICPGKFIDNCNFFLSREEIQSYRCCDDVFIYAVLRNADTLCEEIQELKNFADEYGYTVNKIGRKVYIIPSFINKWDPLEYIMEKEKEKEIITAGDSWLDFPMLSSAQQGFVPLHGELYKLHKNRIEINKNINFTTEQGLFSSEEILGKVAGFV